MPLTPELRAVIARDMQSNPAQIEASDVERVITDMTGIPAERITSNEAERLRSLAEHLQTRVIGQRDAVERVSRSLRSRCRDATYSSRPREFRPTVSS